MRICLFVYILRFLFFYLFICLFIVFNYLFSYVFIYLYTLGLGGLNIYLYIKIPRTKIAFTQQLIFKPYRTVTAPHTQEEPTPSPCSPPLHRHANHLPCVSNYQPASQKPQKRPKSHHFPLKQLTPTNHPPSE